jgi:hypothetical protein
MGLLNLGMQMNPANVTQMPELFKAIIESRPLWATAAFAIAVGGGTLGCVLLLLRKKLAVPVFAVSLAAMIAHLFSYLNISNPNVNFGASDIALVVVAPVAVAVGLLWWARRALQ